MASHNCTPVFLKSDSILGRLLLNVQDLQGAAKFHHESSILYYMVMTGIQNSHTEQPSEEYEPHSTAVLGEEFWESLKNGTVWWVPVSDGLYVYTYGQHLDFGSTDEQDDLMLYEQHYYQCLEQHETLVAAVEASDPAQDRISQEMIKPHVRIIKEKLKFTDNHIRNAVENLLDRGEEVTFPNLFEILSQRQNAVLNILVGTRQYAFSADVQLVLQECYQIYGREPTQPEFHREWERIKEHLMNQLAEKDEQMTNISRYRDRFEERARVLNNQVVIEQARAVQERNRADQQNREKLEAQARADKQHREKLEAQARADQQYREKLEAQAQAVQERNRADQQYRERIRLEKEIEQLKQEKRKMIAQFEAEK